MKRPTRSKKLPAQVVMEARQVDTLPAGKRFVPDKAPRQRTMDQFKVEARPSKFLKAMEG